MLERLRLLWIALAIAIVPIPSGAAITSVGSDGLCKVYNYDSAGVYGPLQGSPGRFMGFLIDGDPDTADSTGSIARIQGCVTLGTASTCSCDMVSNSLVCASYDGSPGLTGFSIAAPHTVTVTIVSAVRPGNFRLCWN